MADADSMSGSKSAASDEGTGRIWRGLKALLFGDNHDQSLRAQLEEAIDEHEDDDDADGKGSNGDLSRVEREMLRNLLHFSEHDVDDVAVPRSDIIAIDRQASFDALVQIFAEHGHSRVPVYDGSLDHIVGMVHIKDVFTIIAQDGPRPEMWDNLIRQPRFVPETMGVLDLLAEMRQTRTHLAIVIDEYSGTEGLVTIEDLVEEIVGDIEDEHDDAPESLLVQGADGSWDADARAELDDVAKLIDTAFGEVEEDVDTLGGLAFILAGEVPETGRVLAHESGWQLEIIDGDERRVTRIRLLPPADPVLAVD
ncbi:hemolysin family protein [Blastomonas sp.]|uniref:hemolysin family protein n=1 Tax=Blastomonas sp. TaxID=1909299 RepID=UPI003594457B